MFDHWSLKKRLTLTFTAILLLAGSLFAVALVNNAKLRDTVNWNTHTYEVLTEAERMLLSMVNIETGLRGFVAAGDEVFLEPFNLGQRQFATAFDTAKSLTSDNPAQQARLDQMKVHHLQFMQVAAGLAAQRREVTSGKATLDALLNAFSAGKDKAAMDAFRAVNAEFAKAESELLAIRSAALDATMALTTRTLVLGGLALCALSAVLGLAMTRSIFRQLGAEPAAAAAAVNAVANGDLGVKIALRSGDTGSLMAALGAMRDSLVRVVSDVRANAESVATASAQIAQGNLDLSGRTEQQASALQETAATMEQLGATVRNNADNARQATQLAQGASDVAVKGGQVVGRVVTTMRDINESSRKVGDIIGVIDGIAFQTNILALNAAVEAARAGDQGRGFAVVASEVRSLAQRSAEAAKEIKSLIVRSVEQVEQGTTLVDEAGQTMDEIVGSIQRVTDIVAEISSANVAQSSGIQQVGEAVTQMDNATQQNAALVEESAAAAASLKTQAQQLVETVAVFKLDHPGRAGGSGDLARSGTGAAARAVTKASASASTATSASTAASTSTSTSATAVPRPAVERTARAPSATAPVAGRSTPDRHAPEAAVTAGDGDADWTSF